MPAAETYSSDVAFSPSVKAIQTRKGSRRGYARVEARGAWETRITPELAAFIAVQRSAFLATASADGQPYIQHRGGPPGFLKALDERTLGVADFSGNRQYITLGNLATSDKASLFLMDYLRQGRMKLFVRAKAVDLANNPDLAARLAMPDYRARVERGLIFAVEAFDWNCRQHITKRLTLPEVATVVSSMQERIAALEAENAALRAAAPRADL